MKKIIFLSSLILIVGAGCLRSGGGVLFDATKWQEVAGGTADLQGDGKQNDVYLLKSNNPVAQDGLGDNAYGVKLVIAQSGRVVFEYSPSEDQMPNQLEPAGYYHAPPKSDQGVVLTDITGDGMPEILSWSGIVGVSDEKVCYTIIRYNKDSLRYELLNKGEFCQSYNVGVSLENGAGGQPASFLKSAPAVKRNVDSKVAQYFEITRYEWKDGMFAPTKTWRTKQVYEDGESAIAAEGKKF